MILAIDCGNTNIVFAVWDGESLAGYWRATTAVEKTADELGVWLTQLLDRAKIAPDAISGAIVASVVPRAKRALVGLCEQYFGCTPLVVGAPEVDLGLSVKVERPGDVGADRLVNAVAAHHRYPGALIVVDFGTATTFDVIAADGSYCGGIIAPGINLSMEALHMAAAQLPKIPVEHPETESVIGTDTVSAMRAGVFWGYIGLIEGLVTRIKRERGEPMTVISTGGLAELFNKATDAIDTVDGQLTLRGLREIYLLNRASTAS